MLRSFAKYTGITGLFYLAICSYFYLIQEQSLFPANTIPAGLVYDFKLPHEEIFIDAPDGARLNGVFFDAENSRGVVLHFHGNAENMLNMEQTARQFVQLGFSFLAVDYRSYGKSTGRLSEQNLFDDAMLIMQFLKQQGWEESQIVLYGRSIGTGVAIQLASKTNPAGVILYSPFYNMQQLVSEMFPFLPVNLLLQYPMQSDNYLKLTESPVLMLHGDNDTIIPVHHAQQLGEIRGRLVIIAGGGHNDLTRYPLFWQEVSQFLASVSAPE